MRKNIAANLAGRFVSSASRAILLPAYVHVLGVESYGLVGVYVTLRNLIAILDFGISASFIRDVARLSGLPDARLRRRELLQTLEIVYWAIAVVAGLLVMIAAPAIARHWLHAEHLSADDVVRALRLMGIATCAAFPLSFYQGGLYGLQRQGLANALSVGLGLLQDAGALVAILMIPSIHAFMGWHVVSTAIAVAATALVLRRLIPAAAGARRFSMEVFRGSLHFGGRWFGHVVGSAVVTQSDKVLVTRFVPLEQFGYYTIAQSLAMFVMTLVGPVQTAVFPRLSQLAASGDRAAEHEYDRAMQYVALLVFPVAAVLIGFAPGILLAWTRKPDIAAHSAGLLRIFAVGACFSAVAAMLTTIQGAHAYFRAMLTASLLAAAVAFPLLYAAVRLRGVTGAALTWPP